MKKTIILFFFLTVALATNAMEENTIAPSTPIKTERKTITPVTPVKKIVTAIITNSKTNNDYVDYPGAINVRISPITTLPVQTFSCPQTHESFFNSK